MLDLLLFVTHFVVATMLNLNYIMTHSFGLVKHFFPNSPPSTIRSFINEILCERENHEIFYNKIFVGGKKCDHCGNLALFHHKYPIDINGQALSNIIVDWKRYEYVTYSHNSISSSNALSKRIDLQEDKINVREF